MRWWWHERNLQRTAPGRPAAWLPAEVLPKLDRLQLLLPRPTAVREGAVRARSTPAPHGFEVHGHRPYAPGDDLRHLDWNAYARTDEWIVRVFRAERESATYLLLDTSGSMHVSAGAHDRFLFACQVATALAYVCLRRHEPVTCALLCAPGPRVLRSPWWRHRRDTLAAARFLAAARAAGRVDLAAAVAEFLARPLLPGVGFVISDFYVPLDIVARALASLAARRLVVVAVHVLPSADFEPAWPAGALTLRDAETGAERTVQWNAATGSAYRTALENHCAGLRTVCQQHSIHYVHLDPAVGLEAALLGDMARAGVIG